MSDVWIKFHIDFANCRVHCLNQVFEKSVMSAIFASEALVLFLLPDLVVDRILRIRIKDSDKYTQVQDRIRILQISKNKVKPRFSGQISQHHFVL